nr:14835_t:CDS:2 [Entrophospora candida]
MEPEHGFPDRDLSLRRGKTLSKPERGQPATPMLPGKDKKAFDFWVFFSRIVTFWAPSALLSSMGGLHDSQSRQAWREKITLCFIAVIMGGLVAFLTVGLSQVLCPPEQASNPESFIRFGDSSSIGHLGILGWQFDVTGADKSVFTVDVGTPMGQDITNFFTRDNAKIPSCQDPNLQKFAAVKQPLCQPPAKCPLLPISPETFAKYKITNTTKKVGFDWSQLADLENHMVINGNVLNLGPYTTANPKAIPGDLMDTIIREVLDTPHKIGGKDATRIFFNKPDLKAAVNCLVSKYYAGNIDKETIGCFTSTIFLYISLVVILGIVLVRFAMACVFDWFVSHRLALKPKQRDNTIGEKSIGAASVVPWTPGTITVSKDMTMNQVGNDLFTVLLVTCYSEGEEGLRCTCESMAATEYPDDRKLLFLICDGIITGSGNDLSTPDICVSLLDIEPQFANPKPQSYIAVASGSKQHNRAKVYAGYFNYKDRKLPTVCVVKCGNPEEDGKPKAGNRGKRDSQLILMHFFSRVTYNDRMCELDYDLFNKVHHLMGITPDFFEIVLMIANKRDSWVTAIQVFEYYVSHHLGKGFESVFGGVTCLPGCFCMYRLKARKGKDDWVPIITKPEIVQEYSQNTVETLHQKNLLLLGEDRFLTTLMLRNFPHRKMMFCPKAVCKTVVPDEFNVLLSQRRRWINSTIHNLLELVLVRNLCGTFCFSMQFVIFMELVGTVVLPVALVLTYGLIVTLILKPPRDLIEAIPLMMLILVLGLPAVLILLTTRKLIYIAWMFIYLLALPVWNLILPVYAYWHFDDFSWGETRKVEGEAKGDDHGKKEGEFDASKVPVKRWEDWERTRIHDNDPLLSHDSYDAYSDSRYGGNDSASVRSNNSQHQFYDYSNNPTGDHGYPPQDQFDDIRFRENDRNHQY